MNAKTLEAVTRHGNTLLAAFPNARERDPVALCRKLRRIETAVSRVTLDYCNGETDLDSVETATYKAFGRVCETLQIPMPHAQAMGLLVNRDPRGWALKIESEWTRDFNEARYKAKLPALHTDMGGYGIIAPDLTVDAVKEREAGV